MHFLTKRDSTNAPDQDERPLTENIDIGFGVLHGCGIGCGTIHLELKRYSEPPSALFVADGGFGSIPARYC